jgi:hypothetical protein
VASAETFKLAGRTVVLEPPKGFCALDPKRPKEAQIVALNEQMQQPRNHVILQLADCDELAGFRTGERQNFERYGQYFTPVSSDAVRLASGQTRASYLAAAAQELPKLDSHMLVDELTKKFTATGSEVAGARFLGVLDQDERVPDRPCAPCADERAHRVERVPVLPAAPVNDRRHRPASARRGAARRARAARSPGAPPRRSDADGS